MDLKKTIAFWDQIMTSITFAEANEHDTARRILDPPAVQNVMQKGKYARDIPGVERIMSKRLDSHSKV